MSAVTPGAPKLELWAQLRGYSGFFPSGGDVDEDLIRWADKLRERMAVTGAYHVDKPLVDYIRVLDAFQRRGIARALYLHGAHTMAARGLVLYASSLQSDEAQAAWRKFEQEGLVRFDGKRRMLDFRPQVPRKPVRHAYGPNMLTKPQLLALLRARMHEVASSNFELYIALGTCELDLIGATYVETSTSARSALVRRSLLAKSGKSITGYETTPAGRAWIDELAAVHSLIDGLRRLPWDLD